MAEKLIDMLAGAWQVLGEMAPWLLFGFLMAGVLSVFVSPAWVQRHLGGRGLMPVIKATLFGVPLPLCSCGVIPVTAGMYRQGASRGASSAFLLATPQTGVDSIFATYALLGPVFAVVRPVVALVTGIIGGGIIDVVDKGDTTSAPAAEDAATCNDCCEDTSSKQSKLARVLRYGFVTLPGDIAWAMIVGVIIAGVLGAVMDQGQFKAILGGGLAAMLIMMLVGTPIYVCSTASIPLALGFMHLGASPGAALVFLITGPATNAATIAVMWKLLGKRSTVIYLLTVIVSALVGGWLIDTLNVDVSLALLSHDHEHAMHWSNHLSAVVLVLMLAMGLLSRRRTAVATVADAADTVVLDIDGMHCSRCADTAEQAIRGTPGVKAASVDLASGKAVVEGSDLNVPALCAAVQGVGFQAARADTMPAS